MVREDVSEKGGRTAFAFEREGDSAGRIGEEM